MFSLITKKKRKKGKIFFVFFADICEKAEIVDTISVSQKLSTVFYFFSIFYFIYIFLNVSELVLQKGVYLVY